MDNSPTSPSSSSAGGVGAAPTSGLSSGGPSLEKLGRSKSRNKNLLTAEAYLNKFLSSTLNETQPYRNNAYPSDITLLTEEHVTQEHLTRFLTHAGLWLAENQFPTRQHPHILSAGVKVEYFKSWKMILKAKFPSHPLLTEGSSQDWHTTMVADFKKQAFRSRKEDPKIAEERTSEAMYRTAIGAHPLARAKFWGKGL